MIQVKDLCPTLEPNPQDYVQQHGLRSENNIFIL
jgi:hypothetical protein